ncbi:hypothetical protein ACHQM5_015864 [Ranunculus cassubicifolius]
MNKFSAAITVGQHENRKKKQSKSIRIGNVRPWMSKIGTSPCSECGRQFSSWKALFGHMRCHPERQWRGIIPPSSYQRQRHVAVTSSSGTYFTGEDRQVAESLLLLSNGHNNFLNQRCFEGCKNDKGKAEEIVEEEDNMVLVLGHQCGVCSKIFSSGQALGGHKRCHCQRGEEDQLNHGLNLNFSTTRVVCPLDLNLPAPVDHTVRSFSSPADAALDLKLGI